MAYPSQSTIRSYGGACPPSYLTSSLAGSYTAGQTFTLSSGSGWYEVDATGHITSNPLGTSGPFTVVVDFSTVTEEKVLCSAVNVSTGVVTVWTDGSLNGRGYDGTTISAHSTGSTPNCFPVATAVENLQFNAGVNTALTNAATAQSTANTALANAATAQSTANAKVASVTAADGTITVAGTATAPTVKVGTVPYAQVSGTPSSLPPSGSAGGDLTGTYPNPTLTALAPSPAGTYGSGTAIPVVTVDAKGRVTGVTTATPTTDAPSGPAGGSLAGTYPNPTLSLTGVATNTYGSASSVPAIGVSTEGRITSATSTAIQITESQVTNLTTDLGNKVGTSTTISTTAPLAGGGDLSTNRTLSIADATTTVKGAVQLTDSTSSTSTTTAATPNSVRTAYELANGKGIINTAQTFYSTTASSLISASAVALGSTFTLSGFTTYLVTFTNVAVGTAGGSANAAINYSMAVQSGSASIVSGGGVQTVGQSITTASTRGTYSYNTILVLSNTGATVLAMAGQMGGSSNSLSVNYHQLSIVGIS